ncbi:hypothetical protein E5288_WYG001076 [Bos mutus]|uniref:Serine hydrolase-like protein 2 n=1 Tax=Bos mutus TaxID=72004 RepID=A0A6B0RYV6_9CETA|nr:hypothetical protein [Bos mutus]
MDFNYVAMDFGGHGLSSHYSPGFPYHYQNFVSEVRRVAAGEQETQPFSCIFPEMVDKLILLESLPFVLDTNEMDNLLTYKRRAIEHVLQVEASRKPEQVVSPEEMLQRLLKKNSHAGEECGKHLLQRGTTQVATALAARTQGPWRTELCLHPPPLATGGAESTSLCFLPGVWLNRDRRITWAEHCLDFVSRELFMHYIKNLQARVLLVKATEGYYALRREDDADKETVMFVVSSLKSVLKERFQYFEVPGNHYIHMNQPQQVARVISSFLQNKEGTPASL